MAMILEVGMEPGIGQINVIVPMRHEPVCPHVHGVATNQSSDGLPECYWTINGYQGPMYKT